MLHLKNNPTLGDIQRYVSDMEIERGFSSETVLQNCLMLGEEIGELFKAIRKQEQMNTDKSSKIGTVEEELADVLIFACAIANRYGIDLEKALREKEEINKNRVWQ